MISWKDGMPKVYLETSYVSYLFGGETTDEKVASDQAITRRWQQEEFPQCECRISQYVIAESGKGRGDKAEQRLQFLAAIPRVAVDDEAVLKLAEALIAGHAVPDTEGTDALHIASAAVAGMDFLLTWNCRHMANPRTLPKTRDIITRAGYICPTIMTPKTYFENLNLEA